jgi:hypothetical protein
MKRIFVAMMIGAMATLGGCGEPIRGIDEDARAAKTQARDAVKAAQDAAQHVDALSRAPDDQAAHQD